MDTLSGLKGEVEKSTKNVKSFIESFIDAKSLVETDAYVRSDTDLGRAVGEGVVTGFATVDGDYVGIYALNPEVLKGSIGKKNGEKIAKCVMQAASKGRAVIGVIDTMGARFNEGVDALLGYNEIIHAYSHAYGNVPVINIVKGNNLGLLSYLAAFSDFTIVYDKSVSATASPLVLSAKCGKDVKKIGTGAELVSSGVATNLVKTDKELKQVVREILSLANGAQKTTDDPNRLCKNLKPGADFAAVSEAFDKNSFFETRKGCGSISVTGFASFGGIKTGIVLTNGKTTDGRLTAADCSKISEHLNTCENLSLPVVFLTDCNGSDINADADVSLMRELGNLLYQVNNLESDCISVVYGKAVGVAYSAFVAPCEYKVAWDNAYIAPLESESAARLVYEDEIAKAKGKAKETLVKKLSDAYVADNFSAVKLSETGVIDNVIEPNHMRQYLVASLQVMLGY